MGENMSSKKSQDIKSERKSSLISLIIGAALTALGIIVSVASYNNAGPGETYTVYYGVVIFGVIIGGRGLIGLIAPRFFTKRAKDEALVEDHAIAIDEEEPDQKDKKPISF